MALDQKRGLSGYRAPVHKRSKPGVRTMALSDHFPRAAKSLIRYFRRQFPLVLLLVVMTLAVKKWNGEKPREDADLRESDTTALDRLPSAVDGFIDAHEVPSIIGTPMENDLLEFSENDASQKASVNDARPQNTGYDKTKEALEDALEDDALPGNEPEDDALPGNEPEDDAPEIDEYQDANPIPTEVPEADDARCFDAAKDTSDNIEVDPALDSFQQISLPFLESYQNPCWLESVKIKTAYINNYYEFGGPIALQPRYQRAYEEMRQILLTRTTQDDACKGKAWRLRCLPYFYLIGVSRCGTTDLASKINKHPHVHPPLVKELNYWNRIRLPDDGRLISSVAAETKSGYDRYPLRHYLEAFDHQAHKISLSEDDKDRHQGVFGDFTPSYLWEFNSWQRLPDNQGLAEPRRIIADYIRSITPQAKIIIILRNPVDRLYSDYKAFLVRRTKTPRKFHQLVEAALATYERCLAKTTLRSCLYNNSIDSAVLPLRLRAGVYYPYINDWLLRIPRKQFFITRLEDYAQDKTQILKQIYSFLDLEPATNEHYRQLNDEVKNTGEGHLMNSLVPMFNTTRQLLHNFYSPYNRQLANLLQDDAYDWTL